MKNFQVAAGTIMGFDHMHIGGNPPRPLNATNSHDSVYYETLGNKLIAVVCDGCGQGDHSEIGAKIGARLIVSELATDANWETAWADICSNLRALAKLMESPKCSFNQIVENFFLFTIVGVVMTPGKTAVFTRGDGAYAINDQAELIDQKNAPNYLAYHLTHPRSQSFLPSVRVIKSTQEVNSIFLASDGAQALLEDRQRFLDDPNMWKNPDHLRRLLSLEQKNDPKKMHDDASLIVIRRTP